MTRRYPPAEIWPQEIHLLPEQVIVFAPLQGATLLHLAIEYHETAVAAWLVGRGAGINARTEREDGQGHTPLYHALLACGRSTVSIAKFLLSNSADPQIRASLCLPDAPEWAPPSGRCFENVTALEYGQAFVDAPDWLNRDAITVLEKYAAQGD